MLSSFTAASKGDDIVGLLRWLRIGLLLRLRIGLLRIRLLRWLLRLLGREMLAGPCCDIVVGASVVLTAFDAERETHPIVLM